MDRPIRDRLAQTIQGASRRKALRLVLAGAATATAGTLARGPGTDARKKKRCRQRRCQARALGSSCETTLQCCPNETNRICAFAGVLPGPICCGVLGASCASINDCCTRFTCFNGRCAFAG
jgi:hypothetical protein